MKLELKHLSAYFPYELICLVDGKESRLDAIYSDGSCCFHDLVESDKGFSEIKPILRPLSKHEIIKLWDEKHSEDADIKMFLNEKFLEEKGFENINEMLDFNPEWWAVGTFKLLVKYKFDVFGIINHGLAIDITKLPQNER